MSLGEASNNNAEETNADESAGSGSDTTVSSCITANGQQRSDISSEAGLAESDALASDISMQERNEHPEFSFLVGDDHSGNVDLSKDMVSNFIQTDDTNVNKKAHQILPNEPVPKPLLTVTTDLLNSVDDPLHETTDEIKKWNENYVPSVGESAKDRRVRIGQAITNTILSVTAFTKYSLPYLETADGSSCQMRIYFPSNLYHSEFIDSTSSNKRRYESGKDTANGANAKKKKALSQHALFKMNIEKRASHPMMKVKLSFVTYNSIMMTVKLSLVT